MPSEYFRNLSPTDVAVLAPHLQCIDTRGPWIEYWAQYMLDPRQSPETRTLLAEQLLEISDPGQVVTIAHWVTLGLHKGLVRPTETIREHFEPFLERSIDEESSRGADAARQIVLHAIQEIAERLGWRHPSAERANAWASLQRQLRQVSSGWVERNRDAPIDRWNFLTVPTSTFDTPWDCLIGAKLHARWSPPPPRTVDLPWVVPPEFRVYPHEFWTPILQGPPYPEGWIKCLLEPVFFPSLPAPTPDIIEAICRSALSARKASSALIPYAAMNALVAVMERPPLPLCIAYFQTHRRWKSFAINPRLFLVSLRLEEDNAAAWWDMALTFLGSNNLTHISDVVQAHRVLERGASGPLPGIPDDLWERHADHLHPSALHFLRPIREGRGRAAEPRSPGVMR